jgi:hypothetical protein
MLHILAVVFMLAMAKIKAEDIDTGVKQCADHLCRGGGGAERRDNFRTVKPSHVVVFQLFSANEVARN